MNDYLCGFVRYSSDRGWARLGVPLSSRTRLDKKVGARTMRAILHDFLVRCARRFGHEEGGWEERIARGEVKEQPEPLPQPAEQADECLVITRRWEEECALLGVGLFADEVVVRGE